MHCLLLSKARLSINTESCEETEKLGFILGSMAFPGLSVLLHGGLGMGKTVLTQGIGRALGIKKIKSPSFIIVAEHTSRIPLAHADLYRLENGAQAEELDLDSYLDEGFLLVIEWAERWKTPPLTDTLEIFFEPDRENPAVRNLTISAAGVEAERILARVADELGRNI